jgi:carbonic anhydrase
MTISRRNFLLQSAASAAVLSFRPGLLRADAPKAPPVPPQEALKRLLAGNQRFVEGHATARNTPTRRKELSTGQAPFAAILCCADSRVPPETIFDQGLGELFVVRLAGNFVDDNGLASLEYATGVLGTQLIYVLGHESCGAVKAALEVRQKNASLPGHLPGLAASILPAVDAALATHPKDALAAAIRANVAGNMKSLASAAPVVAPMVAKGTVMIAGGVYSLDTGKVDAVTL